MTNFPTFLYYHTPKSKTLDVILQGRDVGVESQIIRKVFTTCKTLEHTVIAFNFPYFDRGEDHSSGPELKEELDALQTILDFIDYKKYDHIRLIGKSLGGIVGSFYLSSLTKDEQKQFEIIVLGYVTGEDTLKNFAGKVTIIQGQKDKYGDIQTVKQDLIDVISKDIHYFEIPNADHSYRNPETKEPIYEDQAIELLKASMTAE